MEKILKKYGFVKGGYTGMKCNTCQEVIRNADKYCRICENCAFEEYKKELKVEVFNKIDKIMDDYNTKVLNDMLEVMKFVGELNPR